MSLAEAVTVPIPRPERHATATATATALPSVAPVAPAPPKRERHLRPVTSPAKARKPRVAYAMVALIGAVLIGAAQMGLSLATTATTYEIRELQSQQRDLTVQSQLLNEELAGLSSPQYLAANAAAAGMVIGASPTYLRLSDGAVVGTGEVATNSTVDVLRTPAVPNALIANTPLATAPGSTIGGAIPVAPHAEATDNLTATAPVAEAPQLPPVISDGIPTPETR